jgi:hypothetical protein
MKASSELREDEQSFYRCLICSAKMHLYRFPYLEDRSDGESILFSAASRRQPVG